MPTYYLTFSPKVVTQRRNKMITSYSEQKQRFQVMLISPPAVTQYDFGTTYRQIWIEEDRMLRNNRHYSTVST